MARTFGERFVDEFRRAGGSTAAWAPEAVEALKNADRRTFIAALNRVSSASAKTARHRGAHGGTGDVGAEGSQAGTR